MGKCLFMRKGKTHTAPVSYKANFADNTWEQIIDACQKNAVPETWLVGDQKNMIINGTDYAIDIIGRNHDTYSEGSGTAPMTFQMHDCYGTDYGMDSSTYNTNGWTNCEMRITHLPTILTSMPSEVQTGLKEVNKLTTAGGTSSVISTTADKLFLLSEIEVFGSISHSLSGEGTQYAYYAAGNSTIKHKNGTATDWWERSPRGANDRAYCYSYSGGGAFNAGAASSKGVSFAFCF